MATNSTVRDSLGKPVGVHGSIVKPAHDSVGKPVHNPCDMVVAWYNITWVSGNMTGNNRKRHEKQLKADLLYAFAMLDVDLLLLCECGEIGIGLPQKVWAAIMTRICGSEFDCVH